MTIDELHDTRRINGVTCIWYGDACQGFIETGFNEFSRINHEVESKEEFIRVVNIHGVETLIRTSCINMVQQRPGEYVAELIQNQKEEAL